MKRDLYTDESTLASVIEKFERCEFGLEEFTHARHLTVAAWYLCHLPPDKAMARMKAGLCRFIEHHGKQGYHETITRFWMELLGSSLSRLPEDEPIAQKVNKVVERYENKDVLFEHYTRERVLSDLAKREWVEPDLNVIRYDEPRRLAKPRSTAVRKS